MRLVVTGGGTGGHVYPALEVARLALESGHEVAYYGSLRGQEGDACKRDKMEFRGFDAHPIPRLWTPAGLKSVLRMLRTSREVRGVMERARPDAVFATGGYSAGPVLHAAKTLGIPIILHEQNAVPGRTNRIMSRKASAVCVVFDEARSYFSAPVHRTGMPVRSALAGTAKNRSDGSGFHTLCYGGSQGSQRINEAVLTMAMRVGDGGKEWLLITGPRLFEETAKALERICPPPGFATKAFLVAEEMAEAYSRADLAIARSGAGAVSELALFGIPAVFIPYPHAAADHQYHNAKAIEKIGGASVIRQKDLSPERLESEWRKWAESEELRSRARDALAGWAIHDAAQRVLRVIEEAIDAPAI